MRVRLFLFSSSFQPSWGANVNTGFADFEWLLHVTALCEFPSCRATTSFASRLVIKITDGGRRGSTRVATPRFTRAQTRSAFASNQARSGTTGASYRILPRNSRVSRSNSSLLPLSFPFSAEFFLLSATFRLW